MLGEGESPSLALSNVRTLKALESDEEYLLEIETFTPANSGDGMGNYPEVCPKCGVLYDIKGIGRINQQVKDTPAHGKRISLLFKRRRYQCKSCMGTFMEQPGWLHPDRHATYRLIAGVERDVFLMPNSHVAHKYGLDDKTVKNVLDAFIARKEAIYHIATPRVLGIDELHLMGRARGVFTNIEQRTLIEMLPDRNKSTVKAFLATLDPQVVEVVTVDMWRPYSDAVHEVLPRAVVVVDKFHVVRYANQALDNIRKTFKAGLDTKQRRRLKRDRYTLLKRRNDLTVFEIGEVSEWGKLFPNLIRAYDLKERFYYVYEATTPTDAKRRYQEWKASIPASLKVAFSDLVRAVDNWEAEIFAYFLHEERFTNAYTESMNRSIRDLDRSGRGYSFPALRAKLLYGQEFKRKPVRHKLKAEIQELLDQGINADNTTFHFSDQSLYAELEDATYNVYGTDMESVAEWLETHGTTEPSTTP